MLEFRVSIPELAQLKAEVAALLPLGQWVSSWYGPTSPASTDLTGILFQCASNLIRQGVCQGGSMGAAPSQPLTGRGKVFFCSVRVGRGGVHWGGA